MANTGKKMPALFIGHGSPMNAVEDNVYTRNWQKIAGRIPKPEAILSVSAHWYTDGSRIMDETHPKMVYDMFGFPDELYRVEYKAKGSPELSHITRDLIKKDVRIDNSWGYDHGTWSVLRRMYPEADIPVYQLSIDRNSSAEMHFQIGQEISALRERGVLILGSGNVVHNLSEINWNMEDGYLWAEDFDEYIKQKIIQRQYRDVIDYKSAGKSSELAFYTPEHFYPLLYVLGASREDDQISIFNDTCTMGSMSMTCYLFE
ncbi:4,5-DOPA-extradiol-dioxygenase [Parasporobacterium paucivorans]|uniref:Aromatic ring-opening dioxygenase, catalytic subunit, LigB family n=1 Tax=Parasporobacterium paucivorans DSM 15970 TaxID=1122934 RepID=A0A1M6D104_9FIRM|nr:4,5-DOPA dioxygenase extradiol [Parasporobacterium paucivorans]SHI66658.1 Aromatic ring-opening dioxygenase, catalytic subunit, LigB family [Parasporobacterium paucivorans DSM 15970]